MILVDLTRDMRPQRAGESMLLPAETARRLIAEGAATNPRDRFGKPLPAAAELPDFVAKPVAGLATYKTKRG